MNRSTNFRRLALGVLFGGLAHLTIVTEADARPFCPPGNTSNICTCGKAVCTPPPPPVKYGSRSWGPAYFILSLLYAPPGTASTAAFGNSTTEGTTTGISTGTSVGSSVTASATGGVGAQTTLGVSFAATAGQASATTFTTTATATTGSQLGSTSDAIDHNQDRFFLWLNPQVTVKQTAAAAGVYTMGTANGDPMDVIDVSMAELKNPSLIPAAKMGPQLIHGVTLPGLAGLKPSDFAAIAAMDRLTSPRATPADTNRYVYVESLPLEGPDSAGMSPVKAVYTVSDATATARTTTRTATAVATITVGEKVGFPGVFDLSINFTNTLTWNYSTSAGTSSGTGTQATINLGTSKAGCLEYVDVYADTMFHTMAFVTPQPVCAPLALTASLPTTVLSGFLQTAQGEPQPHQMVTLTLPNGTVRRVVTDSKGRYALYGAPAGTVKINAAGLVARAQVVTGKAIVVPVLKRSAPVLEPVPPVLRQTEPVLK